MILFQQATGVDSTHIDFESVGQPIHHELCAPWLHLKAAAADAGLNLCIASGYRSFQRQLTIWNNKASGLRPVLDEAGRPVDWSLLRDREKLFAILRWSALPGASRHHFGSDIDIYDPSLLPPGCRLQLTREESSGPLAPLHRWLDGYLASSQCGFFRPYSSEQFGVAPEPWHLSYAPLARQFQGALTLDALAELLEGTDILLKPDILANLPEIFERYVQVPWSRYPSAA